MLPGLSFFECSFIKFATSLRELILRSLALMIKGNKSVSTTMLMVLIKGAFKYCGLIFIALQISVQIMPVKLNNITVVTGSANGTCFIKHVIIRLINRKELKISEMFAKSFVVFEVITERCFAESIAMNR